MENLVATQNWFISKTGCISTFLPQVSSVTFRSGKTSEDLSVIKQCDVESRFAGWISCFIDEPSHTVVKIEVKGPDNSLR